MRQFWRDYRNVFSRDVIHEMVGKVHEDFLRREDVLSDGTRWMAGDTFSLADIAWMPNFHRFDLLRWPLQQYPALMRWFEGASARPSYRKALDGWEPLPLMKVALAALDERRAENHGIDSYGPFATA
jgi:glutathione S-transferase